MMVSVNTGSCFQGELDLLKGQVMANALSEVFKINGVRLGSNVCPLQIIHVQNESNYTFIQVFYNNGNQVTPCNKYSV